MSQSITSSLVPPHVAVYGTVPTTDSMKRTFLICIWICFWFLVIVVIWLWYFAVPWGSGCWWTVSPEANSCSDRWKVSTENWDRLPTNVASPSSHACLVPGQLWNWMTEIQSLRMFLYFQVQLNTVSISGDLRLNSVSWEIKWIHFLRIKNLLCHFRFNVNRKADSSY